MEVLGAVFILRRRGRVLIETLGSVVETLIAVVKSVDATV
jgi:hypothetical protein